jgi:predicted RNA-binding protein YlxR (DUF448 family)
VGCGRVAPQPELVRLTAVAGRLAVDPGGPRAAGRGAYLCPRRECWDRAVARRGFARALRRPVEVPPEPLNLTG